MHNSRTATLSCAKVLDKTSGMPLIQAIVTMHSTQADGFVMDFKSTKAIQHSGLAMLMQIAHFTARKRISVAAVNCNSHLHTRLATYGFTKFFHIHQGISHVI